MRYILAFFIGAIFANGSLLDFKYIEDAKSAYLSGDYERARELYGKIEKDEAKFNLGDALYREGKYKEAIEVFNSHFPIKKVGGLKKASPNGWENSLTAQNWGEIR